MHKFESSLCEGSFVISITSGYFYTLLHVLHHQSEHSHRGSRSHCVLRIPGKLIGFNINITFTLVGVLARFCVGRTRWIDAGVTCRFAVRVTNYGQLPGLGGRGARVTWRLVILRADDKLRDALHLVSQLMATKVAVSAEEFLAGWTGVWPDVRVSEQVRFEITPLVEGFSARLAVVGGFLDLGNKNRNDYHQVNINT